MSGIPSRPTSISTVSVTGPFGPWIVVTAAALPSCAVAFLAEARLASPVYADLGVDGREYCCDWDRGNGNEYNHQQRNNRDLYPWHRLHHVSDGRDNRRAGALLLQQRYHDS